jgi:hypothetical protein
LKIKIFCFISKPAELMQNRTYGKTALTKVLINAKNKGREPKVAGAEFPTLS